ncbi:acyl-CoA dehydrogenase family protein [Nocardia vinacea]|uniref:Acyl-CoA dehydrogenase family protein n=1 Tax=Nocardia vinacea TaxID=96468 RepID=A0ABZ1YXD6_9NOCA|nr:acyl-CoA dehydrogenase family protein [Nocardia vinacea]
METAAFDLSPEQADIQTRARAFGEKWAPLATRIDREDAAPIADMVRDTVDMGLAGITIPTEYGGKGLSAIEFALAVEAACRAMGSWIAGDILFATTCTGPSVIMMSDNTAAHAKYLPRIAAGELTASIALTEPAYGSAVTDIETAATVDGDAIVLNGSKRFITGAPDNDLYITFVRLNGTPGMKGIGAVVAEKGTPGFTFADGPEYLGSRGSKHGDLHFTDCRIPPENLLMGEGSFPTLMQAFNMERLYIAALCLGLAEGAFDEAVAYSNNRTQFGRPVNEFQAIYHLVAEMWTQIESVRYLTYKAALTAERGKFPQPLDVSVAKLHAADMGRDVCWKAMQILGGNGLVTGFPPERCFRDVIVSSIAGGTMQVLKNTIAAQILDKKLDQRR